MSKFLSYEDRLIIAQQIGKNASFGAISKELGKDRTTVAKENRKSYDKKSGCAGYPYNSYKHRSSCKTKKVCGSRGCTHPSAYKCSICSECTFHFKIGFCNCVIIGTSLHA